ncbi:hypothetical protein LTR94_037806, partial [Friedmanniomyces endolithicus]
AGHRRQRADPPGAGASADRTAPARSRRANRAGAVAARPARRCGAASAGAAQSHHQRRRRHVRRDRPGQDAGGRLARLPRRRRP